MIEITESILVALVKKKKKTFFLPTTDFSVAKHWQNHPCAEAFKTTALKWTQHFPCSIGLIPTSSRAASKNCPFDTHRNMTFQNQPKENTTINYSTYPEILFTWLYEILPKKTFLNMKRHMLDMKWFCKYHVFICRTLYPLPIHAAHANSLLFMNNTADREWVTLIVTWNIFELKSNYSEHHLCCIYKNLPEG